MFGLLCWLFGHRPIKPYPKLPAYCKWCKRDLVRRNGRYVIDDNAFLNDFKALIEEAQRANIEESTRKLFGEIKGKKGGD